MYHGDICVPVYKEQFRKNTYEQLVDHCLDSILQPDKWDRCLQKLISLMGNNII